MNDETNQDTQRLRQMLEAITVADPMLAGDAASGRSDAETASLREAWLAFGQLVRAADASLPTMPSLAASIAVKKSRRRRWVGLLAATAAALLVAVSLGWWMVGDGEQGNRRPSLAQSETKTAPPTPLVKQDLPRTEKTANQAPKATTTDPSTWEDPLDTEIASVSQQIYSVQQNWQHRVDDVDLVQYRIDEVADSLQNDTL